MTGDYYAGLSQGYAEKIRQLVPAYDEMTDSIIALLALFGPARLLDIGAGAGNFTHRVLNRFRESHLVAIEPCEEMCHEARSTLARFAPRCTIEHRDVLDFDSAGTFDGIYSNLVLHNLPAGDKRRVLERLGQWLTPGGVFVWGDLIVHAVPRVQAHFVAERIAYARAAGCPDALIRESFGKEERDDHPWTVSDMVRGLARAGFDDPQCVWCHDTFAIALATKSR